jgi:hypothetical protein
VIAASLRSASASAIAGQPGVRPAAHRQQHASRAGRRAAAPTATSQGGWRSRSSIGGPNRRSAEAVGPPAQQHHLRAVLLDRGADAVGQRVGDVDDRADRHAVAAVESRERVQLGADAPGLSLCRR